MQLLRLKYVKPLYVSLKSSIFALNENKKFISGWLYSLNVRDFSTHEVT